MSFKYIKKGGCCMKKGGCTCKQDNKLNTYDWLCDLPDSVRDNEFVEVQFKNTRKGYFRNTNNITVEKGDLVAVEATPGHDVGTVSLTGPLVVLQMKKLGMNRDSELKRLYRKVRPVDIEKYEEAKSREHETMLRARRIADDLGLDMKIGDVEYQGDCGKAIFYYIAEGRVDFRQLIKVLAEAFRVRIEMKQIGARQEAGRIGGIGPCGRELCCASWMTSFASVATGAARHQDISLNPQKLAGQCAKLKCCINYEVDIYVEAQKQLPSREVALETKDGIFYHFKTDILKREITYSSDPVYPANLVSIPAKRAFEIIALNKRGIRVDQIAEGEKVDEPQKEFQDGVGDESLTRFDKSKKNRNKNRNKNNKPVQADSPNGKPVIAQGEPANQTAAKPKLRPNPNNKPNPPKSGKDKDVVKNDSDMKAEAPKAKSDDANAAGKTSKNHPHNNHRRKHHKPHQPKEGKENTNATQPKPKNHSNGQGTNENKNREKK